MVPNDPEDLTGLLHAWAAGDIEALERLTPRVYTELHRLARRHMAGERKNHLLQTTALINEAYLRLIRWKDVQWQSRTHFFAMASKLMRRALLDIARKHNRQKRGGGAVEAELGEKDAFVFQRFDAPGFVALDEALTELTAMDPRKGEIVELRFFGGLSVEETAEVTGLSDRTVLREWNLARAWLRLQLKGAKEGTGTATT